LLIVALQDGLSKSPSAINVSAEMIETTAT
jgi:hypothetical protein